MQKNPVKSQKHLILFFIFNLLALCSLSYIAFNKNSLSLFNGLDGAYMMEMVRQQFKFGLFSWFGSTSNIFQSLNNIYFPLNTNLIPGYAISALFNNYEINKTLSYIIFTTEIFCTLYIFCITYKFRPTIALFSGWLFVLLAFPYIGLSKIYAIFTLVPHFCTGITEAYIIMLLILGFSTPFKIKNSLCATAVAILTLHMTLFCPNMIILISPWLIVFAFSQFTILTSSNQRMRFIYTTALTVLIISFISFIFYYYGLFRYTAATFFASEMRTAKHWDTVSLLFSHDKAGVSLFFLGVAGALLDACRQNKVRKSLAIALLFFSTSLLAIGIYTVYFQVLQNAPYILYFEFCVWPLYAIYAVNLVYYFLKLLYLHTPLLSYLRNKTKITHIIPYLFPLLIIAGYFIFSNKHIYSEYRFPYPPATTSIVEHLKNNISLKIGAKFNGRVATFDGLEQELTNWYILPKFDGYAKVDYHLIDLSYNDIPSLFEYSPLISPVFYTFIKSFLIHPQDEQTRNVVVMRKIDPKILRLLGVRYIITDTAINTKAKLLKQSTDPNAFLYELPDVNIGQYSPVLPIIIYDAKTALSQMAHQDFDFHTKVIVQNKINSQIVPAESAQMHIENHGVFHVTGKSSGQSLVVLPIEFSNCLNVTSTNQESPAQLMRVNVLLTGVLFKNELDIRIKYYTGLGMSSYCRISDIADAKKIGIIGKTD